MKSTILIGQKYLFNYIAQSNYCITEIFKRSPLKNNIEIKEGCKFDKIVRENLWEFPQACKYVHQILIIVNEDRLLNKADVGWYGSANFAGKLFHSVHLFPL